MTKPTDGAAPPADPTAMLVALRAAAPAPADGQSALVRSWQAAHAAGQLSGATLADVALLLLQTLREDDDILDMAATDLLRLHGEARHLAPLRQLRPTLRPRGGFRDWRIEVARAISAIEARIEGRCSCTVDARHGAPLAPSGCEIEAEHVDVDLYIVTYQVRCGQCGSRWSVTERHGYHYPSYDWAALAGSSGPVPGGAGRSSPSAA